MQSRIMPGTEGTGANATEIMRKKNYIHGGLIAKAREAKAIRTEQQLAGKKRKEEFEIPKKQNKKKQKNFKDEEFYMDFTKGDEFTERGLSVSDNFEQSSKDAVLDLMPDDKDKLHSRSQSMKWDRKKKRFVGQNISKSASLFGNETKEKLGSKVRNESGQLVSSSTKKANIYKEWQRKSKQSIQKTGEEEVDSTDAKTLSQLRREKRFRHNANAGDSKVKDELKTPDQVAKDRKVKDQNKKRFQRKLNKQKGKPNFHPAKTRRMEKKRTANSRVKVVVH